MIFAIHWVVTPVYFVTPRCIVGPWYLWCSGCLVCGHSIFFYTRLKVYFLGRAIPRTDRVFTNGQKFSPFSEYPFLKVGNLGCPCGHLFLIFASLVCEGMKMLKFVNFFFCSKAQKFDIKWNFSLFYEEKISSLPLSVSTFFAVRRICARKNCLKWSTKINIFIVHLITCSWMKLINVQSIRKMHTLESTVCLAEPFIKVHISIISGWSRGTGVSFSSPIWEKILKLYFS